MPKKIDIIANDGSPIGVTLRSLWGLDGRLGVGGAELAILTLCEGWHNRGYDVTFYNNPSEGGVGPFKQKTLDEFNPLDDRDFLIIFRSPNERIIEAKGKRIWFSTDQQTVGNFKEFAKRVDKIVTISPRHAEYFKVFYGIEDTITIDLPVRDDYNEPVEKIAKRCIYTSIPDRGVMQLNAAWPLIVQQVPEASLVITSDWRLWDRYIDQSCLTPYRLPFARQPNVSYVGAVKREQLIRYQLEADLLLYPSIYDELFGIAVAEAQVAGAIPITSQFGSLPTTNQFGVQIEGSPYEPKFIETFVETAVYFLRDKNLREKQEEMKRLARERFALDRILDIWDEEVLCTP